MTNLRYSTDFRVSFNLQLFKSKFGDTMFLSSPKEFGATLFSRLIFLTYQFHYF